MFFLLHWLSAQFETKFKKTFFSERAIKEMSLKSLERY